MSRTGEQFGIGQAVKELKDGHIVQREGWNGRGMYIELMRPENGSGMDLPFVAIKTANGSWVPWSASQADLLAEDWQLA